MGTAQKQKKIWQHDITRLTLNQTEGAKYAFADGRGLWGTQHEEASAMFYVSCGHFLCFSRETLHAVSTLCIIVAEDTHTHA